MKRLSLLFLLLVSACTNYVAVEPTTTAVRGAIMVEPQIAWSKANVQDSLIATGSGLAAETWTIDGPLLHALTFYTGVAEGQALARQSPDAKEKLPVFRKDMTATDVMELVEATLTRTSASALVKAQGLRTAKFAGQNGFRFEYSYVLKDEVERQGTAVGCIKDGKLYMVVYTGTKLYHFGKYLPQVERIVDSVRFL